PHPPRYSDWKLSLERPRPTLALDVAEDKPLVPGYKLKLNSYDLGVDIELHDALNRIRFEHPAVKAVVITSGKSRIFCSGANIYMLGNSSHAWKVNFCKFTNETRNGGGRARRARQGMEARRSRLQATAVRRVGEAPGARAGQAIGPPWRSGSCACPSRGKQAGRGQAGPGSKDGGNHGQGPRRSSS